jgi:bifunctional enzyme CysN/CysC
MGDDDLGQLRIATAGSVDDGKSTLIGRLLLDSQLILEDQLETLRATERDGLPDLASMTDGLRAEREQGITIDVAYRYFTTGRRSFIIADTPGHVRYTRNMVTGASTADLAVVLIDACNGIVEQSRRHTYLSSLLGIRHLVAAVNKMDLVDWEEERFRTIESEFCSLASHLGVKEALAVPISALHGDNVVETSEASPWYDGPRLLQHLEKIDVRADFESGPFRFPVQWVVRGDDDARGYRGYAGQVAGGTLSAGEEVAIVPGDSRTTVVVIDTFDGEQERAAAPDSVTLRLADDLDVGRGDLICSPDHLPAVGRELEATICWMAERALRQADTLLIKQAARTVRATVGSIDSRLDLETLEEGEAPAELDLNDIARVTLHTSAPIAADRYADNRQTGAFILIDEHTNDTLGAGMVSGVREGRRRAERSRDVVWHSGHLDRDHRWSSIGQRGATVWLTGLPASGKSTVGALLEKRLVEEGRAAYLLDGDNVRHGLSGDLGFEPADRTENIRRVGHAARLFADAGMVAIVSLVSPTRADRDFARELHDAAELPFLEVHVDTPVGVCAERDPKGLYKRAEEGDLKGLTGVDAPYESPETPDVVVHGADEDPADAAGRLAEALSCLACNGVGGKPGPGEHEHN